MKKNSATASNALLAALLGPLLLLYVSLLYWVFLNPEFLPIGALQVTVLVTQLARAILLLMVPRLRRVSFFTVWMTFTPDVLIAAILATLSFAAGDPYLLTVSRQLFGAWPPAFLIAFLPVAIFKAASKMRDRSTPLSETLPFITFIFVLLAIFVSATYSPRPSASGLPAVSDLLFAVAFGRQAAFSDPLLVSTAGTVLAVAMVAYGVSQGAGAPAMRTLLLSLTTLGLGATAGWGLVISSATQSTTFAFAIPALALLATIWGITRAS